MKKIIGLMFLGLSIMSIMSITHADLDPSFCQQTQNDQFCAINGQTLVPCTAISDTSSRKMIPAYDGSCLPYPALDTNAKQIIIDVIYDWLADHITYQALVQTEYNGTMIPVFHDLDSPDDAPDGTSRITTTLNDEGAQLVTQNLFPAIADIIKQEKQRTNPNMMKISILHHVAYMFQYDFDLIDDPTQLQPTQ